MLAHLRDLTVNRDGSQNITVTVTEDFTKAFDALKGVPVNVEIKKASKGRSKDANAMCWALCSDIGKSMTPPLAKEEVYRMAIKAAGVHWQTSIPIFKISSVREKWEERGTGWFMEIVDDAEPGRKLVHMYFGSSSYTVDEMKVLLDWLIDQAEQMEIVIPLSRKQEQELLERWGKR
jgi:hypothetical protein